MSFQTVLRNSLEHAFNPAGVADGLFYHVNAVQIVLGKIKAFQTSTRRICADWILDFKYMKHPI